jgi:hypothetical protein
MSPQTFTTTFAIEEAITWELYKTNLADELFDRAAADLACPSQIKESAYTGEVVVEGRLFSVTLTEGEEA